MAQERCFRKCYQYARLWQVGEVREAGVDDEKGLPVASQHFRLVPGDEKVNPHDVYDGKEAKAEKKRASERDKTAAIMDALNKLDPTNDSHWTQGGAPAVQAVFHLVDFEVSRPEISAVAPDFDRDQALAGHPS